MKNLHTFEKFLNESSKLTLKTSVSNDDEYTAVSKQLRSAGIDFKWSAESGWLIFNTEADKKKAEEILKESLNTNKQ